MGDGNETLLDPVGRAVGEMRAWLRAGRRGIALLATDPGARAEALDRLGAELSETHAIVRLSGRNLAHDQLAAAVRDALDLPATHTEQALLELARRRSHAGGGVAILIDDAENLPAACAARLRFLTGTSAGAVRAIASADPTTGVAGLVRGMGPGIEFVALHDALSVAPFDDAPPPPSPLRRAIGPLAAAAMLGALLTLPDYGLSPLVPVRELTPPSQPEPIDIAALERFEEPLAPAPVDAAPPPFDAASPPVDAAPPPAPVEPPDRADSLPEPQPALPEPAHVAESASEAPPVPVPTVVLEPVTGARPVPAEPSRVAAATAPAARAPSSKLARRAVPAPAVRADAAVPVVVNSHPAAVIEVDGVSLGTTPVVRVPVEPGVRHFTALFHDGRRVEREVDVAGEELFLVFQ